MTLKPADNFYAALQAAGLPDSPAGLAAWIVEKFRAWSDCDGDVERAISRDRMLADISLYWRASDLLYISDSTALIAWMSSNRAGT